MRARRAEVRGGRAAANPPWTKRASARLRRSEPPPCASTRSFEVLVIGAGPAGASAAYWLARHGHDVAVVERKTFPREKTCGDGLTPRAVKQIQDMGLGEELTKFHRFDGLRCTAQGRIAGAAVAGAPRLPVVRVRRAPPRAGLDGGAERRGRRGDAAPGHRGRRAGDRPRVRPRGGRADAPTTPTPIELRARYVVVADGANSRFGRALGTFRTKEWPYGTAIRTYWETPRHDEPWIESALDVKDRNGNPLPGYGWIFPVGDGTVNIGVGLLSTFRDFKSVNTTHLLRQLRAHGGRALGDRPGRSPRAGRSAGASRWAARSARSRARRTW